MPRARYLELDPSTIPSRVFLNPSETLLLLTFAPDYFGTQLYIIPIGGGQERWL